MGVIALTTIAQTTFAVDGTRTLKPVDEPLDQIQSNVKKAREQAAKNLDWFYHLTGGHTHTDFFAIRPTDYSKANEGEDFENIW